MFLIKNVYIYKPLNCFLESKNTLYLVKFPIPMNASFVNLHFHCATERYLLLI